MKLSDQIDAMRRGMVEEHDFAKNQLEHLEKRMLAGDADILRHIDSILEKQTENAGAIYRGLMTIASRIGHLPTPASAPQPAVEQRRAPPPLPPGGARASSYVPPGHLAANATMNDILAAADAVH